MSEVCTVICHIWLDIVFLCIETYIDNTCKKTNNNRLPRIVVPFERHPYSWLFARNCSSGAGLCNRVTLFLNLSVIYVVQFV